MRHFFSLKPIYISCDSYSKTEQLINENLNDLKQTSYLFYYNIVLIYVSFPIDFVHIWYLRFYAVDAIYVKKFFSKSFFIWIERS